MELQDVTKGPGGVTRAAGSLSRTGPGLQQGDLSSAWRCRTGVKSHVRGRVYLTRYAERDPDTCPRPPAASVSPPSAVPRMLRAAPHAREDRQLMSENLKGRRCQSSSATSDSFTERGRQIVSLFLPFLQPDAGSLISSSRNTGCDLQ